MQCECLQAGVQSGEIGRLHRSGTTGYATGHWLVLECFDELLMHDCLQLLIRVLGVKPLCARPWMAIH
jgi:hypothetical protein